MCVHTANVHQHGSLCVCVSVCVCFFVSIFSACLCVSPKSECVGRHLLILDNRKQDVYSVLGRNPYYMQGPKHGGGGEGSPRMIDSLAVVVISPTVFSATHS